MKRFFSLLLCAAMLLSLAACGSGGATGTDANKLVIWHDKEDAVISALTEYLSQTVPDLNIQFEKKTSLTDSLKLVGNDPSAAPDLFLFAHDKIGVFAEMGILAPIEPLLEEGTLENFLPMTLQAAAYKDTLYQLPLYFETLLFMYNRRYMHRRGEGAARGTGKAGNRHLSGSGQRLRTGQQRLLRGFPGRGGHAGSGHAADGGNRRTHAQYP